MLDPAATIERLSEADISSNVALAHSVGWKDVESDWRVLHEAALVLGVRGDSSLLAQGALGDYGASATLAKMIVAPAMQRRGLGAKLLDHLLGIADAARLPIGLCATEQGRPLYASRDFVPSGEVVIFTGTPKLGRSFDGSAVSVLDAADAVQLERELMTCDRSRMLHARCREAAAGFASRGSGDERGYGLATAQGPGFLVGPIIAASEPAARLLAAALFRAAPGRVRIDVPVEQSGFRGWLLGLGFLEQAVRIEMARGAGQLPWQVPQRFALATQAWG